MFCGGGWGRGGQTKGEGLWEAPQGILWVFYFFGFKFLSRGGKEVEFLEEA